MKLVIVGSGGHAKVVIASARAAGFDVTAVVDDDASRWGTSVLGVDVIGATADVLADPSVLAVLAVGSNAARARLAAKALCGFATIVHPSAVVHATAILGRGTVVFAGAVVQPDARVGAHVIVNTGASIDHDCSLGDAVHVAPGARLAGAVSLGDGVLIGIGAAVTPNVTVGAWTTVGAGAAVTGDLAAGVVAVGVPARPIHPSGTAPGS
jgi:sugar O-acyltransferase (sialic acid O-acetyltransferase NeuD family)